MAYNVLKGIVEGSVDQHADQEIDGIKVFRSTISASMFYDTDAGSPCATENKVAITTLTSEASMGVLTYQGSKIAKSNYNLTFDGKTLCTDHAVIRSLSGSGRGLKDVPANALSGRVPATSIYHGDGLMDLRGTLKVKSSNGIVCDSHGVSVGVAPNAALDFDNKKLSINFENTLDIQQGGQNITDTDLVLLYDVSRGQLRHSTLKNLYEGFVKIRIPPAAGTRNCIQFRGSKTFDASDALTFEPNNNTLNVKGLTRTLNLQVAENLDTNDRLSINGSVYKSIKTITEKEYEIQDIDNTILFNTSKNSITAILPPAADCPGRVITIKKVCDDGEMYKVRGSHSLKIQTAGENIDFSTEITLKSNYSIRVLHSDGTKWWIINKSGS
tara:strand:- start:3011 stop:4165 length:1155 start_codon:yes stop_codon:yes gene_type:complete